MATLSLFFITIISIFLPSLAQKHHGEPSLPVNSNDITPCPSEEMIFPCKCWESTLYDAWAMDCSGVYNEDELKEVFQKDLGTKIIGSMMFYGNPWLTHLHNGVFGDYKFIVFETIFTSIMHIEPDVFINSIETLQELIIAFAQISEVPIDDRFRNLEFLQLKMNNITSMPVLNFPALHTLDMGWNPLKSIPSDPFRDLPKLRSLGLSGCELESLPQEMFAHPELMEYIDMFENDLSQISEGTFSGLSAIGTLDLSDSQISLVSQGAFNGMSNSEIGLSDNAISTLEEEIWRPILSNNVSIWLAGNPLECGCDVAWIVSNPQFQQLLNTTWNGVPMCNDGEGLLNKSPEDFPDC